MKKNQKTNSVAETKKTSAAESNPVSNVSKIAPELSFSQRIDKFIELVAGGFDSIYNACKLYVELLQENPAVDEIIISRHPDITVALLKKFELVGCGKLVPQALWLDPLLSRKVQVCPPVIQKQLVNSVIPVLSKTKWGGTRVSKKRLSEITYNDAKIAIGPTGIRSENEQLKILAQQESDIKLKIREMRYVIEGDKVTFFSRCTFSAAELEDILKAVQVQSMPTIEASIKKNQIKSKTAVHA